MEERKKEERFKEISERMIRIKEKKETKSYFVKRGSEFVEGVCFFIIQNLFKALDHSQCIR